MKVYLWLGPLLAAVVAAPVYADKEQSWHGYLIDSSCRASIEGDSNTLNFVKEQTRDCALMPACRKAGYAIYSNGKWFVFDAKGNALAVQYLLKTVREKAFYVSVLGTLRSQTIKVKAIAEVAEPIDSEMDNQEKNSQ